LAPNENNVAIIGSKTIPFLNVLKQRKFQDHEILEDTDFLLESLRESLQKLSSFDEYLGEVLSGKLEWSPAHSSELFWKQNANKLNERDCELVRALSRLLTTSSDPVVLAVAANDLGQYVKYCANGRKYVTDFFSHSS
jgi:V-type H+-transporting ATPase subunit H